MALAGTQTVNLAATSEKTQPSSSSPFPPCGAITPTDPYPNSPSPQFQLMTANVQGAYPYSSVNYPKAQCAINYSYNEGNTLRNELILVTQSFATVLGAL